MQKKVNLAMLALFSCSLAMAQNEKTDQNVAQGLDENAFTFSEAQLGEDDDMSSNVTIYTMVLLPILRQILSRVLTPQRQAAPSIRSLLPTTSAA